MPPCEGQPLNLTVTNAGTNWINWSTGASGPVLGVVNASLYQAIMTDASGCTSAGEFEVHENPYSGWFITGCFEFCDDESITIPGSASLQPGGASVSFMKWEWYVNGALVPGGSGTSSPVAPLNLGIMLPGVYVITVHLVVNYPDGTDCEYWSDPLEITVKTCPCPADPVVQMYCMSPPYDFIPGFRYYHFQMTTNYACSPNAVLQVSSPDGGVTLLPAPPSSPPGYVEGILATLLLHPQNVCFDLDFTDADPNCNCLFTECVRLPECPFPQPCAFDMTISNVECIGHDGLGNPVYSFTVTANPPVMMYSAWFAPGGFLSGLPFTIGPGVTVITTGVFTDFTPADGFCIELYAYDLTTNMVCELRSCVTDPPAECPEIRIIQHTSPGASQSNLSANTQLTIIPNPADEKVLIAYEINSTGGRLMIFDARMSEISEIICPASGGREELNVSAWQPGIYYCMLRNDAGASIVKKLVIIK
jgi:hypothetical protein